jgi:hypothetical protein
MDVARGFIALSSGSSRGKNRVFLDWKVLHSSETSVAIYQLTTRNVREPRAKPQISHQTFFSQRNYRCIRNPVIQVLGSIVNQGNTIEEIKRNINLLELTGYVMHQQV